MMPAMSPFRRTAIAVVIPLLVVVAAYAGYWHYMAGKLRDALDPWAAAQRQAGYTIAWNKVEIGGFPFAFDFHFTTARLGTARPVPVTLEAPALSVRTTPWDLRHWRFTLPQGGQLADATGLLGVAFSHLAGSTESNNADVLAFDATATGVNGTGLLQHAAIANASAHVEVPLQPPTDHLGTALNVALQLGNITLPVNFPGFGNTLSSLSFSLQLKGALPQGPLPAALAAWRHQGGTVEVQYARLHWGSLLVDASGTLALDEAMQPEGAFTAEITGQDAAVDLAVMSGALRQSDAAIVKAVLDVLAKPGPDGQKAITVPLTVQNSRIFLGPAAIGRVPHIAWK